jgi:predicted nucleic acid-binding Zn ribbon protein
MVHSLLLAKPHLTSSPKYRSLARVLESDAQFADWTARRRHEVALTQLLRKHLPRPLAERVRVTDCRDGVLELAASAGAIAATLRQRAPDLRVALARDGVDFNEIRVRVQVAAIAAAQDKRPLHQWDSRHATPLFELADRLADGPLKAALARWSRRARGR